jgi:diphthine-ammonia ligase
MKYIQKGKLISESNWTNKIKEIENSFQDLTENKNKALASIESTLSKAIEKRKNSAVLLSGGIDSTLLTLLLTRFNRPRCYAVGIKDSLDVKFAKLAAQELKVDLKVKIIKQEEFELLLKSVMSILKSDNVIKLSVGSVVYSALQFAKDNGEKTVITGLGSEEIFCGYQRHANSVKQGYEQVHKESWHGLKRMWDNDLIRDYPISKHFDMNVETPFLDKQVIISAMNIHPKLKIDDNNKKIILSELGLKLGLSKELSLRKKKAAQYGSKFDKALIKLAKTKGYKYKKEYLKSLL